MVCLLLIINFYVSVSERELNCRGKNKFLSGAGRNFIQRREKQEKTKNKINYFVFIIIIDPSVDAAMQISKGEVRNPGFY